MLIALITILFLSDGPDFRLDMISDAHKHFKSSLVAGEDRDEVLAALKNAKKRSKEFNKSRGKLEKRLLKTIHEHESSPAEIDEIWQEYHQIFHKHNLAMVKLRYKVNEAVTREEWLALYPVN